MAKKEVVSRIIPKTRVPRKKEIEETPAEKKKKLPTYSEKYEESLIKQLFEEELKRKIQEKEDEEESEFFEETSSKHIKRKDGEWDVPIDEEIRYFDPELSYEITGYRPITLDQGLDFDPTPFREAALTFIKTGSYTTFPRNTKPYNDYWREQRRRCVEGYTVGKYRITGDHYFFLNFYTMNTVNEDAEKATTGRVNGFPRFAAKQYEFFHYVEMCEYIGKDICMLKARGVGFSEILACIGVRPFITTRRFHTIYTANADAQLQPVLDKCWEQLNWLNMNTNGGMKKSRMKVDNIKQKRASLVNKEGVEYGTMSEIEGIVADNPRKVRGNRCERLIFEEAGSNPCLIKSWIQGNALVELGGRKIGSRICGGTGGDSGDALAGLSHIFNNPIGYNVLPYKNNDTRDGRVQFTGWFLPAHKFALDSSFVDNRGVTDFVRFKEHYEKTRRNLEGKDLVIYCAEHCFCPEEALLMQGDNLFDAATLSDQLVNIRVHKQYTKPEPTALVWDSTKTSVKAMPFSGSKLLVVEPPELDESGNVFKNLYVAGIDAIDMGSQDSASDYDVSDFCVIIKKRINGLSEPKYVAMYKDRPRDIREAYDITLKLLTWYNCQALLEYTKISIQQYFKERNKDNLFMTRPEFAVSQKTRYSKSSKRLIGLPATESVIRHGLDLISMYINDYCHAIDFDEMLEQLLNYSYENKKKFDIVAAMQMAEVADEALMGIDPSKVNTVAKEWKDFGYYTDKNGVKRLGTIETSTTSWRMY